MKRIKYGIMIFMAMCFVGVTSGFALSFTDWQAPTVSGTTDDITVNAAIEGVFTTFKVDAENEIGKIKTKQSKLAEAFGTANAHVASAATQRDIFGYDLFAVTVGTMFGLRVPTINPSDISAIEDDLKNNGDIEAGVAIQGVAVEVGLNTSKYLLEGLYVSLRFGYFKLNEMSEFKGMSSFNMGVLANYQIFNPRSLGVGVLKWRGLTVGSGIIVQTNKTEFEVEFGEVTSAQVDCTAYGAGTGNIVFTPRLNLSIDSTAVVVPVDVMTSVRLLWILNFSVGAGLDFNFGGSKIKASSVNDVNLTGTLGTYQNQEGIAGVGTMTDEWSKIATPKLMAGLGFSFGPVVLDIPMTWYITKGFNIGISAGVVW